MEPILWKNGEKKERVAEMWVLRIGGEVTWTWRTTGRVRPSTRAGSRWIQAWSKRASVPPAAR
jgi:hypothetical protein